MQTDLVCGQLAEVIDQALVVPSFSNGLRIGDLERDELRQRRRRKFSVPRRSQVLAGPGIIEDNDPLESRRRKRSVPANGAERKAIAGQGCPRALSDPGCRPAIPCPRRPSAKVAIGPEVVDEAFEHCGVVAVVAGQDPDVHRELGCPRLQSQPLTSPRGSCVRMAGMRAHTCQPTTNAKRMTAPAKDVSPMIMLVSSTLSVQS